MSVFVSVFSVGVGMRFGAAYFEIACWIMEVCAVSAVWVPLAWRKIVVGAHVGTVTVCFCVEFVCVCTVRNFVWLRFSVKLPEGRDAPWSESESDCSCGARVKDDQRNTGVSYMCAHRRSNDSGVQFVNDDVQTDVQQIDVSRPATCCVWADRRSCCKGVLVDPPCARELLCDSQGGR